MSKVRDGVIGHAIGDAMGVPLEFSIREKLLEHPVTSMRGYGSHPVPEVTWSDNTSMEIATHGHTAAEVIFMRVDANKDNVVLTNFKGNYPTKSETEIAKNYLTKQELNVLNRMVTAYLDIAEINALDRHPMTMKDWINELDSFLKMTRKDILTNSGTISHEKALKKLMKNMINICKNI